MFGIALIAILAITGGAIAYIGDKLGTKVGKKKLTIFGLRPKHTSIVVTIITGILITVSTIGILTLVSRDVRTALFGMKALQIELASLSQEVGAKNLELDTSRKAIEESHQALEAKNAEYAVLNMKVQDTAQRLAAIESELSAVIAQRDHTESELQQTQAEYAVARGDLSVAQQAINTLQNTKRELDKRVHTLTEAKTSLQADVDSLNQLTAKLNQGIQDVREGSIIYRSGEILSTTVLHTSASQDDTASALSNVIYKTNQNIIEKLNIADKNLEVLWIAQTDFDKVVAQLSAATQDMIVRITASGNTVYGEPVVGHMSIFPNNRIYKQGQTIQMTILDVGQDPAQAEGIVMLFLQKVNTAAVKQGILPDPIHGTVGAMGGNEFYDVVKTVKRYTGKVTLTATARNDTYAVGPLKIEIHVQGSP